MDYFQKDHEHRIVTGIALVADVIDHQSDRTDVEGVRSAIHSWAENGRNIYVNHEHPVAAGSITVLESYQSPTGFRVDGHPVAKGSWVLVLKVHNQKLWEQIKESGLGFSVAGSSAATRHGSVRQLEDMDIREVSILLGVNPAVDQARILSLKSKGESEMTDEEKAIEQLKQIVGKYLFDREQEVPGLASAIARMAVAETEAKLADFKKSLEARAKVLAREREIRQRGLWDPAGARRMREGLAEALQERTRDSVLDDYRQRRSFEK